MPDQFMYVIAANSEGPVKLGISADPDQRVRELQTGHPEPLKVLHREPVDTERVRLFERLLHRDNNHHRLHGEWFDLTVEQATAYVIFTLIEYDLVPIELLRRQLSRRR
jgi:T5orf172 domain